MKKIFALGRTVLIFLFLSFLPRGVFATVEPVNYPTQLVPSQGVNVPGAQHFYSVFMRGNGEAVVGAKLVIENTTQAPIMDYSFRIKNIALRDAPTMVQELRRCKLNAYPYQPCRPEVVPDFARDTNVYLYDRTFAQLQYVVHGDTYVATFAEPIPVGGQGVVLLRYRSFGYTSKEIFGRRHITFETFDVAHELRQVQVSIATDNDLFLHGGSKNEITYGETRESLRAGADLGLSFGASVGLESERASQKLVEFSNLIGRGGQFTKTAQELAAHETFVVKTSYATTWFGLYWSQFVIAFLLVVFFALFVILILRRWYRHRSLSAEHENTSMGDLLHKKHVLPPMVGSLILGFVNALLLVLASFSISAFPGLLYRTQLPEGLMVLAYITVFFVMAMLLFAPSMYFGYRHGKKYGFFTAFFLLMWLILGFFFFGLMFSSLNPRPIPYYYQGAGVQNFNLK